MKISDCHTDFLTILKDEEIKSYFQKLSQMNLDFLSCAVFTTEQKYSIDEVASFKEKLTKISEGQNLKALFSIEDCVFIVSPQNLKKLISLQPFSATLTWNNQNQFAGGAGGTGGLSQLGKNVVELFEENKILVDTAHLNRKSFFEFSQMTELPIYNSHSNIDSLKKHKRNLTDKQIELIVKSEGFLGLTLYQKFISNKHIASKDIALQFDYLIKNFGYKNFGFGTDFFGIDKKFLPTDIQNYSDLHKVENWLKELGYSSTVIEGIFYQNFRNFIKRVDKKFKQNKNLKS